MFPMQNGNSSWQNGGKWYAIGYCEIGKGRSMKGSTENYLKTIYLLSVLCRITWS